MADNRPNVLYFIAHDLGRFLGCYDRLVQSPNLDRFACEGVQFNQAYCSAPCCGPSRVCAMTGLYSHATATIGLGNWGWLLPPERTTLVDHFNAAGYETAHFGFCHERQYGEMRYQIDGKKGIDERNWKCSAELAVDNAAAYLRGRDTSRPFYINLATNHAHLGSVQAHDHKHGNPVALEEVWIPPNVPDSPRLRQWFSRWYASIFFLDRQFGRLMDTLDELDLRRNTLVVFTTDHGACYHRGKGSLYDLGCEIALLVRPPAGMRTGYSVEHLMPNIDFMPAWLEACGIPVPDGIHGRSFWPLLQDKAYAPHDAIFTERNYHGEFRSVVKTNSPGTRDLDLGQEYVDCYDPQRAIRTPQYHYIRNYLPEVRKRTVFRHEITGFTCAAGRVDGEFQPAATDPRPGEELYHVSHDPWEQLNLAQRPEYQRIKAELGARLDRWMSSTEDFLPEGEIPKPWQDPPVWPTPDATPMGQVAKARA